ncbi:MAG: 3-ketoacyl-ACP reductase [Oscillospiraceae bacterium]
MSKIAFVTGGSRGIGSAIAKSLSQEGYKVIISGTREACNDSDFDYIVCDNKNIEAIQKTIDFIIQKYGKIDVLVNNAGVAPKERNDILEMSEESYDFVLDTNLKGTFFMCQAVSNAMIKRKKENDDYSPRIINISSVSAYAVSVNRGEYCISKAGISMVTKLFAQRLSEFSIPVFEVRPGIILTDMTMAVKEKYENLIDGGVTPIKRMGTPQDVAKCVLAAVSGNLDFTTGQVLLADGGFHLRSL